MRTWAGSLDFAAWVRKNDEGEIERAPLPGLQEQRSRFLAMVCKPAKKHLFC
jgi:hypothetical protein